MTSYEWRISDLISVVCCSELTFDPITLGHMDIIRRGAKLVDRLVIGVTTNIAKSPLIDDDERIEMVRKEVAGIEGDIRVVGFTALLMDFAEREWASAIRRGLRSSETAREGRKGGRTWAA